MFAPIDNSATDVVEGATTAASDGDGSIVLGKHGTLELATASLFQNASLLASATHSFQTTNHSPTLTRHCCLCHWSSRQQDSDSIDPFVSPHV